jgi:hypothetical protein
MAPDPQIEQSPAPEPEPTPQEPAEGGKEKWGGTRDHKPGHKPPGKPPSDPKPQWGGTR